MINPEEWLEAAAQKRQRLSSDPHRPRYHFLPPDNWMNDPNGLFYWQGKYHMFYQHNPNNPFWGDIHWGHAVSDDLVHWKDLPLALLPEMPPVDDGGCWSGCAIDHNGVPTLFYTGVKNSIQGTCIATGDMDLLHWQKDAANPIAVAPKRPDYQQKDYRDPYLWREGDTWYQVIGTAVHNRGEVLLYRSKNLRDWEFLHPLIPDETRGRLEDGADICECPNFFPLGNKHVLVFSVWRNHILHYPVAFVGEFRDLYFYPESKQRLDWGLQCFYAPLSFKAKDRQLMFGWLQEQRSKESQIAAGWSGVMSLPRVLSLNQANELVMEPASELKALRQERWAVQDLKVQDEYTVPLQAQALELQLTFRRGTAKKTGLRLQHSAAEIRLYVNWEASELLIEKTNAGQDPAAAAALQKASLKKREGEIKLQLYLDHSVLELFVDDTTAFSTRFYPIDNILEIKVFTEGGSSLLDAEVWQLSSIWP
jgi:beta-fructofuranosidase